MTRRSRGAGGSKWPPAASPAARFTLSARCRGSGKTRSIRPRKASQTVAFRKAARAPGSIPADSTDPHPKTTETVAFTATNGAPHDPDKDL